MSAERQVIGGYNMKRYFVFLTLTAIILSGCAPSLKDLKPALADSDSGNIWFANAGSLIRTNDSSRFKLGDPVVISGDLSFPTGAGPFPAVILAPGCDGTVNAIVGWASVLREWGYATFIIDSFRGRDLSKFEVCITGSKLTPTQRIPDVYGALRILATHPKIDAHRVVLMGFSQHGGWLTLSASTVWAKKTFVSSGQPTFRAFFSLHPPCNIIYPELKHISAPLRIHIGELDDMCPAAACVHLAETLRDAGENAATTVYPGAYHWFDNSGLEFEIQNTMNYGGCVFEGRSVVGPFKVVPPGCETRGSKVGWNPEVTEQAHRNVKAQLTELLK